jgi:L-alanine-DL-glutamate epimerase-like enolase superfamily enzyme
LLEIPTKPGIGFELDPDKVEKYSGVRGFLD